MGEDEKKPSDQGYELNGNERDFHPVVFWEKEPLGQCHNEGRSLWTPLLIYHRKDILYTHSPLYSGDPIT